MRCTATKKSGKRCYGVVWAKTTGNTLCHYHTPQQIKDKDRDKAHLANDVRWARYWLADYEAKLTAARKEVTRLQNKRDAMQEKLVKLMAVDLTKG